MKYILIALLLLGCSNRDELITQMMNEKKVTEDSIVLVKNYESFYTQKAKEGMRDSNDSLKWQSLADSSTYFYGRGRALKEKLRAIEFSIDSLSKIK